MRSRGQAQPPDTIVILTGAGLSAESGLATFRDQDGIWSRYDWREVATPEGFRKNPDLVHEFYNLRRREHAKVAPNAAHKALARLEANLPGRVLLVTQNIDALHEAAGSKSLIHMHGELLKAWCALCDARHAWTGDIAVSTACPSCGKRGGMRPDVVWFGEMPYRLEEISTALSCASLFISIGTSGHVYPAAGFVEIAARHGARTLELNLEPSEGTSLFDRAVHGPATELVPAHVARLLGEI